MNLPVSIPQKNISYTFHTIFFPQLNNPSLLKQCIRGCCTTPKKDYNKIKE